MWVPPKEQYVCAYIVLPFGLRNRLYEFSEGRPENSNITSLSIRATCEIH